jgi:hypothetical protein
LEVKMMKIEHQYIIYPCVKLLEEGISYKRQLELGVMFDLKNNQIIIPN